MFQGGYYINAYKSDFGCRSSLDSHLFRISVSEICAGGAVRQRQHLVQFADTTTTTPSPHFNLGDALHMREDAE